MIGRTSAVLGQTLAKKYLLRRVIGEGGMAVVYEVEHTLTKRIGALKLLRGSHAGIQPVVERFIREASAAGRIGNPHIVETIDAGELPSGEPYLFMELLSGEPLRVRLIRGRLAFEEAREIVTQAAEGLGAAHAVGIVHRDIKPDNLFVCGGNPEFVKILDFGISKFAPLYALEPRLTMEGAPLGTPHYMSPEQVSGQRDVDPRTDIYSLAVVLYECIAGKVPFDAETLPALSIRIFEGELEPLAEVAPGVPPGLDELLRRAMAVEPSRRYQTMAAFRAALLGLGERAQISLAPTQPGVPDIGLPGALLLPGSSELPVTRDTSAAKPERVVQWRWLMLLGLLTAALLLFLIRGFAPRHSGVAVAPDAAPPPGAPRAQVEVRSHGLQALPARTAPLSPSVQPSSALASETSAKVTAPRPARLSTRDAAGPSTAVKDGLSDKNPFAD